MPNPIQVTGDDEPFLYQQDQVDASMEAVREALSKVSLTNVCIECGEEIGAARKKAVPSATLCIDCQEFKDEYKR
jgi:phage/conjugal plasmid C-4 type zinc finger TraR family protein